MQTEQILLELITALGSSRMRDVLADVCGESLLQGVCEDTSEAERARAYRDLIMRHGLLSSPELLHAVCVHHREQAPRALAVAHAAALPVEELLTDADTSRTLFGPARERVTRTLPKILARQPIDPCNLLTLAGLDTGHIRPGSALEQHIEVCKWLGDNLPATIRQLFSLLDEAQDVAFSIDLSDWAAGFCEEILAIVRAPASGGSGGDILPFVRNFARRQGQRWQRIEQQAISECLEFAPHAAARRVAWQNVALALSLAAPPATPVNATRNPASVQDEERLRTHA